jgi:hypothetical protein
MFQRIVSRVGASNPAETSASRRATGAVEFADGEVLEPAMFDHPGRRDLAGGVDDAADGALGSNRVPLRGAAIDALQMMAVQRAALALAVAD